jgi:hypothetical protein
MSFGIVCEADRMDNRLKVACMAIADTPLCVKHTKVVKVSTKVDLDATRLLHTFPFSVTVDNEEFKCALALCGRRISLSAVSPSKALSVKLLARTLSTEIDVDLTGDETVNEEVHTTAELVDKIVTYMNTKQGAYRADSLVRDET